jgi:P27 family predicted phage terminase small subunit
MPARKPTALKLVTGTHRPNRADRPLQSKAEPTPPVCDLPVPLHLSNRAQDMWRDVVPLLSGMGVLTTVDARALEQMCECYADILDLRDALTLRGSRFYESRTVTGGTMHRAYPEVGALSDADRRFLAYLSAFGLTPASRSRVSSASVPDSANPEKYFA